MKDHPNPGHPQHPRPHSLSHTQTAPLAPTTRWPRPQRAFTFLIISRHSKATASVEAAHRVSCARAAGVTIVLPPPPLTAEPAVRGTQQQDAHPQRLPELPGGQGHTDRQTDSLGGRRKAGLPHGSHSWDARGWRHLQRQEGAIRIGPKATWLMGAVISPGRRARVGYSALTAQASGSLAHPLTSEGSPCLLPTCSTLPPTQRVSAVPESYAHSWPHGPPPRWCLGAWPP